MSFFSVWELREVRENSWSLSTFWLLLEKLNFENPCRVLYHLEHAELPFMLMVITVPYLSFRGIPFESTSRYSKVRATAEGEVRHFRRGLSNTAFVVRAPCVNVFKKRFQKNLTEVIPILPIDWTLISPFWCSSPPMPRAQHPLTLITSICYPTPCSTYVVSSGP